MFIIVNSCRDVHSSMFDSRKLSSLNEISLQDKVIDGLDDVSGMNGVMVGIVRVSILDFQDKFSEDIGVDVQSLEEIKPLEKVSHQD